MSAARRRGHSRGMAMAFGIAAVLLTALAWSGLSLSDVLAVLQR